jgi:hypothetical protein
MRLSTMIVLLVIVLVLMAAASRPEIWSHLFPSLDQPAPAGSADGSAKTALEPANAPHAVQMSDQNSHVLMGSLIVVAIAYAFWRITRLTRAITARSKRDRTRFTRTEGASRSPVTAKAESDGFSETEPEAPVPIEEPESREGEPRIKP